MLAAPSAAAAGTAGAGEVGDSGGPGADAVAPAGAADDSRSSNAMMSDGDETWYCALDIFLPTVHENLVRLKVSHKRV